MKVEINKKNILEEMAGYSGVGGQARYNNPNGKLLRNQTGYETHGQSAKDNVMNDIKGTATVGTLGLGAAAAGIAAAS